MITETKIFGVHLQKSLMKVCLIMSPTQPRQQSTTPLKMIHLWKTEPSGTEFKVVAANLEIWKGRQAVQKEKHSDTKNPLLQVS